VTLWDHCFELPHKHLEAEDDPGQRRGGSVTHKLKIDGGEKLELYDYPGGVRQRSTGVNPGGGDRPDDEQKISTITSGRELRMQEEAAAGLVIRGLGIERAQSAARSSRWRGHFRATVSYLLTEWSTRGAG
jgi:type VI secretion system secreted protein VgrG